MSSGRIFSIDIMRGLTLLLMLFVNDLNMDIAPRWLGHMPEDFDGMGLADWVFPGFLFIVGLAVPFAFAKRISGGDLKGNLFRHILMRSVSLLIIGVLMLNTGRVNPELTGISKNFWALLMYLSVFLIWNDYFDKENRFFTVSGFRLAGLALLVFLVFKFRSGEPENNGSLITGWWGILGLIGWGYLVTAFTWLLCRDSVFKTSVITAFFLGMNILTGLGRLDFLNGVKPFLGVIIEGNVPLIMLSGLLGGIILKRSTILKTNNLILVFTGLALFYVVSGFLLRNYFIISKIRATPSWGMICSGISFMVFILIYWLSDVRGWKKWALFVKPAGENSLTAYLAPDILYYFIWIAGIPVLFYKQSANPLVVVAGSVVWALLMVWLTAVLARFHIRLRL
jgi:heparan-alpha-glucosaminide N-acetyltransferase